MRKFILTFIVVSLLFVGPQHSNVKASREWIEQDAELPGISFVTDKLAEKDKAKPPSQRYNIEEGDILFISINQKAQSNVKYRTAGWIVRKSGGTGANEGMTCTDKLNPTDSSKLTAECTPRSGANYFEIPKSDFIPVRDEDYPIPGQPMHLKSVYVMKKKKFEEHLNANTSFRDLQNGVTLYFNSVFEVTVAGVAQSPKYYTLSSIRNARPWANKTGFRQYYDQPLEYIAGRDKVTTQFRLATNQEMKLKPDVVSTEEYRVSDPVEPKITIPRDFTSDVDKKDYTLLCSYIQPATIPTKGNCNSEAGYPYFKMGPELLQRSPMMARGGTSIVALYKEVTPDLCSCSQEIFIPGFSTIGGKIETSAIHKKVPVQVKMLESEASIKNWETYLKTRKDITLLVRLWRSDVAQAGSSNTGAEPIWEKITAAQPDWQVEVPKSAEQIISYLRGHNAPSYQDNLMNYPIQPGGKVSFRYNVSVSIVSTNSKTGQRNSIGCTGIASPQIDFYRPAEPPPEHGIYTSTPQYWSEIKQGSPSLTGTGSNEQFEAMAGTPTTRNLYFASGGSEFIVDIETKYEPQATATRTYTSKFEAVVNGWAMSPISGGYTKDSPPAAPAPRQKTDDSGATFTETVTAKSRPYVKVPAVPCSGDPCTGGSPAVMGTEYGWDQSGYPSTMVGGYSDTWTQTVTFDYMRIVKVQIWKLERSKLGGMTALLPTNEVTATVTQGEPSIFYNIASSNTSAAGRLRYSREPNQHDHVVWTEGPSDNTVANSKSGKVDEQKRFDERRALDTNVTAISDFVILQTSTGDQAVMYFEKPSPTVKVTEPLEVPVTNFQTMWTNNSLSAAKWSEHEIKIGSYNGKFATPNSKYSGSGGARIGTVFDNYPAGMVRPARPSAPMRLMATELNVRDTIPNGLYTTGQASVFYRLVVNHNPNNAAPKYATSVDASYGLAGQSYTSAYSDMHSKVNDVVIHNPVSTEYAMIERLPDSLDQRTASTVNLGGNIVTATVEYERKLREGYVFVPTPPTYGVMEVPNPDYKPPTEPTSTVFNYTGAVQQFTVPKTGTYVLEAWGAQGGYGYTSWTPVEFTDGGGKGAYAKGSISLTAGEALRLYVGQYPGRSYTGGWNGGGDSRYASRGGNSAYAGAGGGASDIRRNGTALTNRILVAGGGGGSSHNMDSMYSAYGNTATSTKSTPYWGDGAPGSQTEFANQGLAEHNQFDFPYQGLDGTAGTLGVGGTGGWHNQMYLGNSIYAAMGSGGGGGYYGGGGGAGGGITSGSFYWGGSGGGGSSYTAGLSSPQSIIGYSSMPNPSGGTMLGNAGHGKIRITTPGDPAVGEPTIKATVMTHPGISSPPDSAYEMVPVTTDPNATMTVGSRSYTPGNFVVLDREFTVFFPNIGNFAGNAGSGLSSVSPDRGKGFTNGMDVTEWTKEKAVKFSFNVIYNNTMYLANEWIPLPVSQTSFSFYVPLANKERISALVEFRSIAINGTEDNTAPNNKVRYSNYAAKHSGSKQYTVDIIGRIGNMTIVDTGDFRYSNLFKMPLTPEEWLVSKVIRKVNQNQQFRIVGDTTDIRGNPITSAGGYLDTYGLLSHLRVNPIALPLSPEKNNVQALRTQPIRLGYSTLTDIQTIGNYYDQLQIIPYYYVLDLQTGVVQEADIYVNADGQYKPVNKHGAAVPNWDPASIYPHTVGIDWIAESGRRSVRDGEIRTTDAVANYKLSTGADARTGAAASPYGNKYNYGTAQIMHPNGRNRTYIGSGQTNGINRNPGNRLPAILFQEQAQRWHYSFELPSSAVVVAKDQQPTQANIDAIRKSSTKVLLLAADIKAVGDTFILEYKPQNANGTIQLPGFPARTLSNIPYPVVNVYSVNRSSADDLDVFGTH